MNTDDSHALLTSDNARKFVLAIIRWLDLRIAEDQDGVCMLLARAFVAAGEELLEFDFHQRYGGTYPDVYAAISSTLEAARAYVEAPSEANYGWLEHTATESYPFGAGQGCYAVEAIGASGCAPGSGCVSGAGSLAMFAEVVGWELAAAAIRRAWSETRSSRARPRNGGRGSRTD